MIVTVMPMALKTRVKTNGTATMKTNSPRRIMPTILKASFASFIFCSPFASVPLNLGLYRPQQLYADCRSRVPTKILNVLARKLAVLARDPTPKICVQVIPVVACLILFGDNYTHFGRYGRLEFKKSV